MPIVDSANTDILVGTSYYCFTGRSLGAAECEVNGSCMYHV